MQAQSMESKEYIDKIAEIQDYFRNGKFSEAAAEIQMYTLKLDVDQNTNNITLVDSEMVTLLIELLVFGFLKLKEYKNARQLSQECI